MRDEDREDTAARYSGWLKEHGETPQALGLGKNARQSIRFAALTSLVLQHPESSVLDVGCGFADLYTYLTERGWRGKYTGIDITMEILSVARKRHPGIDVREADLTSPNTFLGEHDFVMELGVFNTELKGGDNLAHTEAMIIAMHRHAKIAVCADFLTTHVDFRKKGLWYADPAWAYALGRRLTRRLILRSDYMPFEFALYLFKDDAVTSENVFTPFAAAPG